MLICATVLTGCGGVFSEGETHPTPTANAAEMPPGLRGLRVQVAEEVAIVVDGSADPRLNEHLKAALQSELGRQGLTVVRATDKAVDLTLRIETRVTGAVNFLRGHVGLTAEQNGVTVAWAATEVELHSDGAGRI